MASKIEISGKVKEVSPGTIISDAAREAGILPDAYLFLIDGVPVPMDTPIEDGQTVKAIKVASGG
jgi:sulfur carrier protein